MTSPFNVLKPWKAGDTRQVAERALKQVQLDGKYDSYSKTYQIDGHSWEIQSKLSQASGETMYTLVCVGE